MSLPEGYAIRRATADDINTLVAHRRAMFVHMGYQDEEALDAMAAKCHPWLHARMNREEYLAWLATAPDQSVVAGTGLWLMDWANDGPFIGRVRTKMISQRKAGGRRCLGFQRDGLDTGPVYILYSDCWRNIPRLQ
jgi:hypothetical protein